MPNKIIAQTFKNENAFMVKNKSFFADPWFLVAKRFQKELWLNHHSPLIIVS